MIRLVAGACAAAIVAGAAGDPLAPARDGAVQCYAPDVTHKTCHAMSRYSFDSDGTIQVETTVLLSEDNLVMMRTVSPVTIKNGAVCGPLRKEDVKSAAIFMNGRRLSFDDANMVRVQVQVSMEGRFGKEVCTTYEPRADEFYAHVTVDGERDVMASDFMRWVKPDDGYSVAP